MSHFPVGTKCLLLTFTWLTFSGFLEAQENPDPFGPRTIKLVSRTLTAVEHAEQRIGKILDQQLKSPMEFKGMPLADVCSKVSAEYGLLVVIDTTALNEIAIDLNMKIALSSLSDITLRSALNLMLRQPGMEDLTFSIEEEVLLVTTKERANESLTTRVYQVQDFELINEQPKGGATAWADYCPLIAVMTKCVEFDSWSENGRGEGEIMLVKPGMLVVTQSSSVHLEIKKLLFDLREARAMSNQLQSTRR